MVHSTSIIPGLSKFIDNIVLSQFSPTSPKRIIAAGGMALALKNMDSIMNSLLHNPMIKSLNVVGEGNMVDLDTLRNIYKEQISKAGVMRISFPIIGDIDFTASDVDELYNYIMMVQ
jgi:hypothetical protein